MKKLLVFLLAALMLTALCACGDDTVQTETNNTTQPVGDNTTASRPTKVYYKTDAAGSTFTTVIVLPEEGETFPIQTIAPTEASTTTPTTAPTFAVEESDPFNDAVLQW